MRGLGPRYTGPVLALLLISCTGTQTIKPGGEETAADTGTAADTAADSGEPARDLDEDGYAAGEDCMDLNAAVHPGAEEVWNQLDDDCDGRFDADGTWAGTATVNAQAVYEGNRYTFRLGCPFAGERKSGTFEWLVSCTTDADDEKAQLLLGPSFTIRPEDGAVELERWEGDAIVESAGGWDTPADATIVWSTFDSAGLAADVSAASLSMAVGATISRQ